MMSYSNLEKLAYQRQLVGAGIGAVTGGGAGYLGSSRDADEDEGRFRSRRLRNTLIGSALGGALGGGIGHMTRAKPAARTPAANVTATDALAAPQPALIGVDAGHVTPQVIATETTHAPRAPVSAAPITEQSNRTEDALKRLRDRIESQGGAQGDLAADATLRSLRDVVKDKPNLSEAEAGALHEALDAEVKMRSREETLKSLIHRNQPTAPLANASLAAPPATPPVPQVIGTAVVRQRGAPTPSSGPLLLGYDPSVGTPTSAPVAKPRGELLRRRVMEDRVRHAPTPEVIATNVPHVAAHEVSAGGADLFPTSRKGDPDLFATLAPAPALIGVDVARPRGKRRLTDAEIAARKDSPEARRLRAERRRPENAPYARPEMYRPADAERAARDQRNRALAESKNLNDTRLEELSNQADAVPARRLAAKLRLAKRRAASASQGRSYLDIDF